MPRKARLIVSGAFHHLMARGIEGRDIFADTVDREKFLSLLEHDIQRYDYRLYGWVMLSNHSYASSDLGFALIGDDGPSAQYIRPIFQCPTYKTRLCVPGSL
ncbi:MAG: hypothetical protein JW795_21150 [Chitinivibrionales bacterium]|nr:hypothetical protein [Chitinivibrionales bacterium]